MKISNPEMKVVRFANEDVIATSLYYASAADFNSAFGTNFTSDYVEFNGSMTGFDSAAGGWYVSNVYGAQEADSDSMEGLKSGGSIYLPEYGITIPSTAAEPIARQAYSTYSYNDGLYTKGATYYELYWQ